MKIYRCICDLIGFAQRNLGLNSSDVSYVTNNILDILSLPTFEQTSYGTSDDVDELISDLCSAAREEGVWTAEEETYYVDKIMGALSMLPSSVDSEFQRKKTHDGTEAMSWLYQYCVNNNYVKKAILSKNPRFDAKNGLVVTINLAKPEFRDPKKAAAGNSVKGGYPKCVICRENEGFASRNKCTLRTVSLRLNGKSWFWQFSPYGYFYQHGIAVNTKHIPMHVDAETVLNLMDFVDQFPKYFIGCNAALERIGGSVLGHDHYQGGGEILPLHKAKIKKCFTYVGRDDLTIGYLDWPGNVVRIIGKNKQSIVQVSEVIRQGWENFTDESQNIICRTEKGQHNAISPTVVKKGDNYEVNIILRSNVTSAEYPDGIFHAHPEFHMIKKESIGLIEAQGLFILPGRLVGQLNAVENAIVKNKKLPNELQDFNGIYAETKSLLNGSANAESVHLAMQDELASVCYRILQNTAVFKTDERMTAFLEGIGFEQK